MAPLFVVIVATSNLKKSDVMTVNDIVLMAASYSNTRMSEEQRCAIKFCVLTHKSRQETMEMLKEAYGDHAPGRTTVYEWYRRFDSGRESVRDSARSGRPKVASPAIMTEIRNLLNLDRRITVRELSDKLDLSVGLLHRIIHDDLNMRRLCARWIPKMLTMEQKARRVSSCASFLRRVDREGDRFLDRIVTVDETWISLYDPETKQQSSMWKCPGSPSPTKFKMARSTKKRMFIVFYDRRGVVLCHTVPEGQTVNSQYYSKVRNYLICAYLLVIGIRLDLSILMLGRG